MLTSSRTHLLTMSLTRVRKVSLHIPHEIEESSDPSVNSMRTPDKPGEPGFCQYLMNLTTTDNAYQV